MTSAAFASLQDMARDLDAGTCSARDLVETSLDRIARLNDRAKAFITVTGDDARRAADESDERRRAGRSLGALDGLPFASKDLIDIAGVLTTAGSKVLADNVATDDAHIIERMRSHGAVSLGKTNLHEFAYGATGENPIWGTAVNAYDRSRLAGGSSSGSASAVAFGLVPAAFGTDTGGSVRAPAALSGLVGLKPTFGRISTCGVIPYSWSLDHVGTLTAHVGDAALLLAAVAGHDGRDPTSANQPVGTYMTERDSRLDGLRVGLPSAFYFDRADEEIVQAAHKVAQHLESLGARLCDIEMPDMRHCRAVSLTVQMPESLSFHMPFLDNKSELYGDDFRAGLALGQCLLAEHYVRAKRFMTVYRQETDALLGDVDVILTPGAPVIAPKLGTATLTVDGIDEPVGNAVTRYTTFFNMTGHPAITLPSGLHSKGLPMSVQLIGRYFDEALLFKVATAIEAEEQFRLPQPAI
jgi:aspartyl-tRNA(Asn)/glutamyl-tRNA(Gln) amidotransferase subunit A